MDFKELVNRFKEAKTASSFYDAFLKLVENSRDFIDEHEYSSRDSSGIAVDVKIHNLHYSFENALDDLVEKESLDEVQKDYIEEELGEEWASRMFDYWIDWERENIALTLSEFIENGVIKEKELTFAGRSGGHLILGDEGEYEDAINTIERYIYSSYFDKTGTYIGDEKFSEFLKSDDYDDIIGYAETLKELDVYSDAIKFVNEAKKNIPNMWKEELQNRLDEWYQDNQEIIQKDIIEGGVSEQDDNMEDGGDVVDNSFFGKFMQNRFAWVKPNDSYYATWKGRWTKGLENVWNEGDLETRQSLIEVIQEINPTKEVELKVKDKIMPISYLFVMNRFGKDFTDSYVSNWHERFKKSPEILLGYMDDISINTLVEVLKLKKNF